MLVFTTHLLIIFVFCSAAPLGGGAKLLYARCQRVGMTSPVRAQGESPDKQFRSWGEAQIGRMLGRYTIPYLYEHPVAVVDDGKTRIWYPDFQLRGYGILIEYCGLPHDPHYAEGIARKETVYRDNGLTALMLTPDLFRGDWPARVLGQIETVLAERFSMLRSAREHSSSSNATNRVACAQKTRLDPGSADSLE
jgi:hypothetical protein